VQPVTRLGITLGDPAGIGPEIVAAALAAAPEAWRPWLVVYGDRAPLERGARAIGVALPPDVAVLGDGLGDAARPGQPDERTGAAQVGYLEAAVAAAQRGEIGAIATAPISKTWARRAGFAFPGHTEYLASRAGVGEFAMMLAGPKLRVTVATTHVALRDVASLLTIDGIASTIWLTTEGLVRRFGIAAPRVAVAGLNPHASEAGRFGDEEDRLVRPAIEVARARIASAGLAAEISGPHVPDVVFRDAAGGRFDAVVALYHDQGLIPLKLLHFDEGVNVTLGLPFVRTSPDHGTAYDIAGTGRASPDSFLAAFDLAARLVG